MKNRKRPNKQSEQPELVNTGNKLPSVRAMDIEDDFKPHTHEIPVSNHLSLVRDNLEEISDEFRSVVKAMRIVERAENSSEARELVMAVETLFNKTIGRLDVMHKGVGVIQRNAFEEEVARTNGGAE